MRKETDGNKATDFGTKIVKEDNDITQNYIFQNSKITQTGVLIIVAFLIFISIGVAVSGFFFE